MFSLIALAIWILIAQRHFQRKVVSKISALDDKIAELTIEVQESNTIMASATTLIQGFGQRLQDAIDAALAAGATAAELQSLTDLKTALDTNSQALAAAVQAGTPVPPNP